MSARCNNNGSWRIIAVLNRVRGKPGRQGRRLRHERIGGEIDGRANRAIIVVIARLLGGLRLRVRGKSCRFGLRISAMNAVDMDVPKRHGHLQGERKQRQPGTEAAFRQK